MDATKKLLKLIATQTQSYLKCLNITNKTNKKHITKSMVQAICVNLKYSSKMDVVDFKDINKSQTFSHLETFNTFSNIDSFSLGRSKEKHSFLPLNRFSISIETISHSLFDRIMSNIEGGYLKQQKVLDHEEYEEDDYVRKIDYDLSRDETKNTPRTAISFFQALKFCNELSKKHGLTPYYNIDDQDWVIDDFLVIAPSDKTMSSFVYDNFLFNPTTFELLNQEEIQLSDLYIDTRTGEIITKENYDAIVEVQEEIRSHVSNFHDEFEDDENYGTYQNDLDLSTFSYEQASYGHLFNEIPPTIDGFAIEYNIDDFECLDQDRSAPIKNYYVINQNLTVREETKGKILINENANGYRLPYSWELLYIVGIENQRAQKKNDTFDVHNPCILNVEYNQSIDLSLLERITQDDLFFLEGYAKSSGPLSFDDVDLAIDLYQKDGCAFDDLGGDDFPDSSTFNDTSIAFLSKSKIAYDVGVYDVIGNTRKWVGDSLLYPKMVMSEISQNKRSHYAEIISRGMVGMTFGIGNSNFKKLFVKGGVFDKKNPYKINLFDKNGKCTLMDVEHAAISQDDISMFICKNIPKKSTI